MPHNKGAAALPPNNRLLGVFIRPLGRAPTNPFYNFWTPE
jgi:hypothetical protein